MRLSDTKVFAKRSDIHLLRKIWHILCGVVALGLYVSYPYEQRFWAVVALVVALVGFSGDFLRLRNPSFNKKVMGFLAPIMRKSEKQSFSGLPFYALGLSISLFLYSEKIAILSILFLVFSDPIASFVGVRFGKDQILPNKTLQGTLGAFLSAAIITFFYLDHFGSYGTDAIMFSLFSGIFVSLSELVSAFNIDDNLTIPVLTGGALTFVNGFLGVL